MKPPNLPNEASAYPKIPPSRSGRFSPKWFSDNTKAKIPIPTIIHERIAGPGAAELARSLVIPNTPLPIDELTTRATRPHLLILSISFPFPSPSLIKLNKPPAKYFLYFASALAYQKQLYSYYWILWTVSTKITSLK